MRCRTVFWRCRHAGAGTVIGAVSQGVLVVCLPRGADQFANAEQVTRLGAGLTLRPDQVSVESIRNATRRVLDETSYATAAARSDPRLNCCPIHRRSSRSLRVVPQGAVSEDCFVVSGDPGRLGILSERWPARSRNRTRRNRLLSTGKLIEHVLGLWATRDLETR
jgi:hypothetical protein